MGIPLKVKKPRCYGTATTETLHRQVPLLHGEDPAGLPHKRKKPGRSWSASREDTGGLRLTLKCGRHKVVVVLVLDSDTAGKVMGLME